MNSPGSSRLTATLTIAAIFGCGSATAGEKVEIINRNSNSNISSSRSNNQETIEQTINAVTIKNDMAQLSKLIQVPDSAISAAWQSGDQPSGNDWWLAALIEFLPDSMPDLPTTTQTFTLPIGFNFEPPFDKLFQLPRLTKSLPAKESASTAFLAETMSTEIFENAPLLNGIAVKTGPSFLFVFLLTM